MNVDANVVIQLLSERIAKLEVDLAVKEACIRALEAEKAEEGE